MNRNVMSFFAGVGGIDLGFKQANSDFKTVYANEFDKNAIQTLGSNWTNSFVDNRDIREVSGDLSSVSQYDADVMLGGFPCTLAGSKIKTVNGYKAIEDVRIGDMVETHKNRYCKVNNIMSKMNDHYNVIKGTGVYDLKLTDNHPVYIYDTVSQSFRWLSVCDLNKNQHLLTFNINTNSEKVPYSDNLLWLMGRYLADGYYGKTKRCVTFAIRQSKRLEFETHLSDIEYSITHSNRGAVEYNILDTSYQSLMNQFGNGALNKRIPENIFDAPVAQIKMFIAGYLSGDGYIDTSRTMWSSVSESLALGMQKLFLKVEHRLPSISVRHDSRSETFNDTYNSQLRPTSVSTFVVGDYLVSKIRQIERIQKDVRVYNISVEDDNSYTIDNVIVHNCQSYSVAGYRKGLNDSRGMLFFDFLKVIKEKSPSVIMMENVKNLAMHDSGNSFRVIKEFLVKAGYHLKWKVLNGKDYGNIPQNRERIYIVGFKDKTAWNKFVWPEVVPLTKTLSDVIDFDVLENQVSKFGEKVESKYFYSMQKNAKMYPILAQEITRTDRIYQWRRQYVRENKSGVVPTLTANMGTGGHNVPLILTNNGQIRKLTPREAFNIQGFPVDYIFPEKLSNSALYKEAGNSVVVPVIKRIAEKIDTAIGSNYSKDKLPDWTNKATLMKTIMVGRSEGEAYPVANFDSKLDLETALAKQIQNGVLEDVALYDSNDIDAQQEQFSKLKASKTLQYYTELI